MRRLHLLSLFVIILLCGMFFVGSVGAWSVIDKYEGSHAGLQLRDTHPSDSAYTSAVGENVTIFASYQIGVMAIWLSKYGSPTTQLQVQVFAVGSDHLPTGESLAESDVLVSSVLDGVNTKYYFNFTGSDAITLVAGEEYWIGVVTLTGGSGDYPLVSVDNSDPTYSGGMCITFADSAWGAISSYDLNFELFSYGYDPDNESGSIDPSDDWVTVPNYVAFIVYFVVLGLPPFMLGLGGAKVGFGLQGLLFGCVFSLGIGVLVFSLPYYLVLLVGLFAVIFLYSLAKRS